MSQTYCIDSVVALITVALHIYWYAVYSFSTLCGTVYAFVCLCSVSTSTE